VDKNQVGNIIPGVMTNESSRINLKEGGAHTYPCASFVVRISSSDTQPPHFHIEAAGWDIAFAIADGAILRVVSDGIDYDVYDYIIANVQKWLQSPSANRPKETNQENAQATWDELHDTYTLAQK
jgi:hypothetical protein